MSNYLGMEPDAVEAAGRELKRQSDILSQSVARVDGLALRAGANWQGRDAQDFINAWRGRHRGALLRVQQSVEGLGTTAIRNATEQRQASSRALGGGRVSGGSGSWSRGLVGLPGGGWSKGGALDYWRRDLVRGEEGANLIGRVGTVAEEIMKYSDGAFSGSTLRAWSTAGKIASGAASVFKGGIAALDQWSVDAGRADLNNLQRAERATKVGVSTAAGAYAGAKVGAVIGTFIPIPVVGTVAGAVVGGAIGGVIGSSVGQAAIGEDWRQPLVEARDVSVSMVKKAAPHVARAARETIKRLPEVIDTIQRIPGPVVITTIDRSLRNTAKFWER